MAEAAVSERLFSLTGCQDPYPIYAELLDGPAMRRDGDGWLAVHYDAVLACLRDGRFGHEEEPEPAGETLAARVLRTMFIKRNPPDHSFLRGLVAKSFTPKTVRDLRPATEAIVDRLLDALHHNDGDSGGRVDLLVEFASALPIAVIADMFGVPESDRPDFRRWSEDMVRPEGQVDENIEARATAAGEAFGAYLFELVAERRRRPGTDLVSTLVAASDADPRFDPADVIASCQLLLFAGHETTVNLIANAMLALFRHPDERRSLAREPALIGPAVEEFLRYDGPVHLSARVALEPVELAGVTVEAGTMVTTLLGAANRDPRRFDEPGRLDLRRSPNPHVGFGFGIHFCLGAALARMEAQIAIPALLARFPTLQLGADPPAWRHSLMLRGMTALPVEW